MTNDNIKKSFDGAERIGVIGSPSSTNELTVDILGTAIDKKLVGTLCAFHYMQDNKDHYAMGQITEIELRNIWSEDPTIRGLIRQKGRVDPVTERQDTHTARMTVSSVFSKASSFEPSFLGTVPATGTSLKLMNEEIMQDLMSDYKKELFYVGKAYGNDILLPMWFKHFGLSDGGVGEAYHIGVFGKTGSGKSVLSKMIMMGYATHPSMSILVLDPQGEFAKLSTKDLKIKGKDGTSRPIEVYGLHNIALTDSNNLELFKKILISSGFFDKLGIIHDENKGRAANEVVKALRRKDITSYGKEELKPWEVYKREWFNKFWGALADDTVLANIYTSQELRGRITSNRSAGIEDEFYDIWASAAKLFTWDGKKNALKLADLLKKVTDENKGSIVIIDLAETSVPKDILWNDKIRFTVIKEILRNLTKEAEAKYRESKSLNTLVIIDEAHRLAPREKPENTELKEVKETLIDAVRTTRKYGLGWMFISQTLSSLDKDITTQIRIYIFGFGLGWGSEYLALREIIGGIEEAIKLYQLFRDPQSTLGDKQYPFMTIGPISPLSFSGMPLFFTALKYPEHLMSINKLG